MTAIEELTQDDIDRMESAIERYKKENQKFRTERDEFKAQAEAGEVNEKFVKRTLEAEAKLKLSSLGIKEPDRVVKYLKLDGVAFDDDGGIKGLDESIEIVKTDFPELFDTKRRVGGKVDAAATGDVKTEKSVTDMQVDALFRR